MSLKLAAFGSDPCDIVGVTQQNFAGGVAEETRRRLLGGFME